MQWYDADWTMSAVELMSMEVDVDGDTDERDGAQDAEEQWEEEDDTGFEPDEETQAHADEPTPSQLDQKDEKGMQPPLDGQNIVFV